MVWREEEKKSKKKKCPIDKGELEVLYFNRDNIQRERVLGCRTCSYFEFLKGG